MAGQQPNVSELAAMFGGSQQQSPNEKPPFKQKPETRKWQPPGGAKPPLGAKPKFGGRTTSSDNILERTFNHDTKPQNNGNVAFKKPQNTTDPSFNGIPETSPKHKTNGDVFRNKTNEEPSSRPEPLSKPLTNINYRGKTPDENHQMKNHSDTSTNFSPPPERRSFLSNRRISSTSSVGESVKSSYSDKATANVENEFPSGGSFTSNEVKDITWKRRQSDDNGSNSAERPSFLHRSSTSSIEPPSPGPTDRRRRPLPPRVYEEAPPSKPRKPSHVQLPNQQNASNMITSSKRGDSFLSRQRPPQPLPSVGNNGAAPALPGRHPSSGDILSHLSNRPLGNQEPPALPGRHPPISTAPSLPDRPVPPIPGSQTGSGSGSLGTPLLERPPPLPSGGPFDMNQRSLPSLPNGRSLPPTHNDRPPLPPPDNRRDSSSRPLPSPHPPLPSPNPLIRKPSLIKTWDNEDEEGLYDDTPDAPPLPTVDNYRGTSGLPAIPQEGDDQEGEIYEPIESEIERPRLPPTPQTPVKEDEKKKKEAEKKEKEMRKKFKLPLEGEIPVQTSGSIKSDSKWFEKFTVHAGDSVDIIKTTDTPKGKWLVRNKKGAYGFIDSINVELDLNKVRETMRAAESTRRDSSEPPPLPPINSPYRPAFDPPLGGAEAEDLYDETADGEDLYESL